MNMRDPPIFKTAKKAGERSGAAFNRNIWITGVILALCLLLASVSGSAQQRKAHRYEIVAVYLHKFLFFVDWPQPKAEGAKAEEAQKKQPARDKKSDAPAETDSPSGSHAKKTGAKSAPRREACVTIGIVGQDPFKDYFAEVEGAPVKDDKKLEIKRFGPYRKDLDLKKCQVLFICASEGKHVREILKSVRGAPVLTVSETKRFLESGGMVNLISVEKNIRWEVNTAPVKEAGLCMRAQLLRNAVRTVDIPFKAKKKSGD